MPMHDEADPSCGWPPSAPPAERHGLWRAMYGDGQAEAGPAQPHGTSTGAPTADRAFTPPAERDGIGGAVDGDGLGLARRVVVDMRCIEEGGGVRVEGCVGRLAPRRDGQADMQSVPVSTPPPKHHPSLQPTPSPSS